MRMRRWGIATCCLTVLLAGGDGPSGDVHDQPTSDAHDRAVKDARAKADRVEASIRRDVLFKAEDYAYSAAQIEGVDVMSLAGTTKNTADGVTLVIRATGRALVRKDLGTITVPMCFRLRYKGYAYVKRDELACPEAPPLAIGRDAVLPKGIDEMLQGALPSGGDATESAVRAAVDGLDLPAGIVREVTTVKGVIGVAVHGGRYDCVMARVRAGVVEVWRPTRVQLAPGELSCTAATATTEGARHPPH